MEKTTNNAYPATIEDLLDQMQEGKFKHLQIFLRHNTSNLGDGLGQKYLVANRDDFGVYTVMSVDYCNGNIQLVLTHADTGNTVEINLDVNDEHPSYLFIHWEDIRKLVLDEMTINYAGEDLLELDDD